VAMAPRTPTLIARAVFEDISPPFADESGQMRRITPAVHRLKRLEVVLRGWTIRLPVER
jgi:hypothetical protein